MTPQEATEIIKQHFDVGDCHFYVESGWNCLSIDLPTRTLNIDKFKTPEDLIYYSNRHWIQTEVQL